MSWRVISLIAVIGGVATVVTVIVRRSLTPAVSLQDVIDNADDAAAGVHVFKREPAADPLEDLEIPPNALGIRYGGVDHPGQS